MHQIVRADVPEPVWDEFRGIMVIPAGLADEEADAAVAQLVRERSAGATREEAAVGPVAR